ncbi:hypothetical protein CJ260_03950 [Megasphaera sp. ASD88]|uniref:hypothetical protein n=1 Tax=Megasphaera sp. ASD88 TaxID=2027407 RepID=UPI000BABF0B9|nr:hypothetical protein [Megasphaera sp. ASD88]PAV39343.1 hypothetical protein CJ260_03950 [Megasphaera sp. ASD88]
MNTYLVMFENGFALEPLEGMHHVISNYSGISILPFPSKEAAYCEGCRRHTARKLTYPWYMPILPRLEDMMYNSVFTDPTMLPSAVGYDRYFCSISQKYAGIFTNADYVVSFLQQYPNGNIREVGTHAEALSFINQYYLRMIYPMSAYIQTDKVPIVQMMGLNTLYELPYLAWMNTNCQIVGPFKTLPVLEGN